MTSPLGVASAAEPIQPPRCQWLSDQDAHFHHARRFQSSPLAGYFKWTSKADTNPHDHGQTEPNFPLLPYKSSAPLFFGSPPAGLGGLDQLHPGLNDLHRNTNSVSSIPGGGGASGHHGGLNYVRTTSSGSLSGPPTPTNGGPNTPLVIPQPVKPPNNNNNNRPDNKTYQCKICDQIFTTKSDMLIHCQQIHKQDPKPYKCSTCSKSFANSSCLSQHSRIHSGHKPYKCEICERKFTQLSHLQQHIRTHTGEKPYKCMHPGCGKAFSQLSSLQSHSRSHMTDKPFRCNSCYKCYADEHSLREHIPKHSETKHLKTHICQICGKSYTQETYLTRHMAKHSQENMPKMLPRPIKWEPMDLVDRADFIGASRLPGPDRSMTPSDLSIQTSASPACSKGSGGSSLGGGVAPSSAFMPLSPFGANTVSSSSAPAYHYSPGLGHNSLGSPLPHISSMASPRYFPYDPIGFGRKASDTPDRGGLNMSAAGVQRESMIANSLLSLQHIKNYASQQMPSFTPTPTPGSRLAWPSLDMD